LSTPDLQLETLFVLDHDGRIVATREPGGTRGPMFALIRSATRCAWAVRADAPAALARELDRLARQEPPASDLASEPVQADAYRALVGGDVTFGPAFAFPPLGTGQGEVVEIRSEDLLAHHFRGWIPGEIEAGREPVFAVVEAGHPVSICFCARRSAVAAEAGVETAPAFRGRGYGARVTAAWAAALRASGLLPLYSTSWKNQPSLAVARKLRLVAYASDWSLEGEPT
jgi:hypothetical protein